MSSYLLRPVDRARTEGRIAGTAQILETGEVVRLRDLDELMALLLATTSAPAESPEEVMPAVKTSRSARAAVRSPEAIRDPPKD